MVTKVIIYGALTCCFDVWAAIYFNVKKRIANKKKEF